MSLSRTIRPLEQATIRSRVGRTSQPFTTAALTRLVRAGAGLRPDRRRHALGESDGSLHIARSLEKTRRPWLLGSKNKALATAPSPSGMAGRFPEAPISCSSRKAGLSNGSGPCSTTSGSRLSMSRCPSSTGAQHGSGRCSVQHTARAQGQRRCQSKRSRTVGRWPRQHRCLGLVGPNWSLKQSGVHRAEWLRSIRRLALA